MYCISRIAKWLLRPQVSFANPEKLPSRPVKRDVKAILQNQLNTSALNTALAFEPYQDLTTSFPLEQPNILFSPLGLASALALLCRISGSESRKQTLQALGVAANASHNTVEATITALEDLQHNLTLGEGEGEGGVQNGQSEAAEGVEAVIGSATGEADAANSSEVNDGVWGRRGTEDGSHARGQLGVWSNLHVDGKPSLDFEGFLSRLQNPGQPAINISFEKQLKDLQGSDKLILSSFVYFKGSYLFCRDNSWGKTFEIRKYGLHRFITQSTIFKVLVSVNFDDYGLKLIKLLTYKGYEECQLDSYPEDAH